MFLFIKKEIKRAQTIFQVSGSFLNKYCGVKQHDNNYFMLEHKTSCFGAKQRRKVIPAADQKRGIMQWAAKELFMSFRRRQCFVLCNLNFAHKFPVGLVNSPLCFFQFRPYLFHKLKKTKMVHYDRSLGFVENAIESISKYSVVFPNPFLLLILRLTD